MFCSRSWQLKNLVFSRGIYLACISSCLKRDFHFSLPCHFIHCVIFRLLMTIYKISDNCPLLCKMKFGVQISQKSLFYIFYLFWFCLGFTPLFSPSNFSSETGVFILLLLFPLALLEVMSSSYGSWIQRLMDSCVLSLSQQQVKNIDSITLLFSPPKRHKTEIFIPMSSSYTLMPCNCITFM